jgi:glycerate kinase
VQIRKVVAAPDKFKGTATAHEVAAAIGHACWELGIDCVEVPMADGGDGILDALGGPNRTSMVTGPLGDPIEAQWRLAKGTAVIEMARASGLALIGGAGENSALDATTSGTGELIDHALDAGSGVAPRLGAHQRLRVHHLLQAGHQPDGARHGRALDARAGRRGCVG